MNKRMTALAVATLSSLTLLGCNSDSNDDSELSNNNTGDTLILTNDGMISSIDRITPNKIVSNLKITGFDISPEMLAEASKLKRIDGSPVYHDLIEVDLTAELPKNSFDAMISAGTFTHGHLGAETFISLIALVRANGWLVIGINSKHFSSQGFGVALKNACDQGLITQAQFHNVQIYGPESPHYGDLATIAIFQRLK